MIGSAMRLGVLNRPVMASMPIAARQMASVDQKWGDAPTGGRRQEPHRSENPCPRASQG
jgi:hypothetical protein